VRDACNVGVPESRLIAPLLSSTELICELLVTQTVLLN
jgi:hypothetical protein